MLNELKKSANKSYVTTAVIVAVIGVILLAVTKFGIFTFLQGPKPLNGAKLSTVEGEYITVDVKYPLEIYEEDYEENTDTHQKRTTDYGYVVLDPDSEEFYGIIMGKANADKMEQAMEEAYAYLTYETDEDVKSVITVNGTVKKMDSQSLGFFNQTMEYIFGEYDYVDSAWYIDADTVKGEDIIFVVIMSVIAAVLILVAVLQFVFMATGQYKKGLRAYLKKHPQESEAQLEAEFGMATEAYKGSRVGQKHTFVISGRNISILDNMDVIWCYYYHRSGRYSVSQLRYYTMDKKMKAIDMTKAEAMAIMECFEERLPHIMLGYDKNIEKQFRKDFTGFLNLKYNPAKSMYGNADAYGNGNDAYGSDPYASGNNGYGSDPYANGNNTYGSDSYNSGNTDADRNL